MNDNTCMQLLNRMILEHAVRLSGERKRGREGDRDRDRKRQRDRVYGPVVARVGLDLALFLHVDACGGDGAALAAEHFEAKAEFWT